MSKERFLAMFLFMSLIVFLPGMQDACDKGFLHP
jgi:hypothetical protein